MGAGEGDASWPAVPARGLGDPPRELASSCHLGEAVDTWGEAGPRPACMVAAAQGKGGTARARAGGGLAGARVPCEGMHRCGVGCCSSGPRGACRAAAAGSWGKVECWKLPGSWRAAGRSGPGDLAGLMPPLALLAAAALALALALPGPLPAAGAATIGAGRRPAACAAAVSARGLAAKKGLTSCDALRMAEGAPSTPDPPAAADAAAAAAPGPNPCAAAAVPDAVGPDAACGPAAAAADAPSASLPTSSPLLGENGDRTLLRSGLLPPWLLVGSCCGAVDAPGTSQSPSTPARGEPSVTR